MVEDNRIEIIELLSHLERIKPRQQIVSNRALIDCAFVTWFENRKIYEIVTRPQSHRVEDDFERR